MRLSSRMVHSTRQYAHATRGVRACAYDKLNGAVHHLSGRRKRVMPGDKRSCLLLCLYCCSLVINKRRCLLLCFCCFCCFPVLLLPPLLLLLLLFARTPRGILDAHVTVTALTRSPRRSLPGRRIFCLCWDRRGRWRWLFSAVVRATGRRTRRSSASTSRMAQLANPPCSPARLVRAGGGPFGPSSRLRARTA